MSRGVRIFIVAVLCAAVTGGVWSFAESKTGFLESNKAVSSSDQALYAEIPTPQAQTSPFVASSTEQFKLPILVYHIVRPSYPSDSRAVRALAHTPEVFDAEMKYLADAGYHVVSFNDLERHFKNGAPLPGKPVVISFDDGWSDQFQYAFPILEKYHYSATFFVFTNPIGTKGFITWDELRTMRDAGMTIGSHSRSHPYLTRVTDPTKLRNEIVGSKQVLEKELGVTITEFAYPFGQYNASVMAAVVQAGYLSARGDRSTKGEQTAGRLYELDALNAPTTTALFAQKFPASN
jgi:peptidoglycan/xylan/chitin deacetylase (PgdA/CDA1 family)